MEKNSGSASNDCTKAKDEKKVADFCTPKQRVSSNDTDSFYTPIRDNGDKVDKKKKEGNITSYFGMDAVFNFKPSAVVGSLAQHPKQPLKPEVESSFLSSSEQSAEHAQEPVKLLEEKTALEKFSMSS